MNYRKQIWKIYL